MTVLATWLDISINLLLFAFVCICLLMSVLILMQRPKNEGLGAAFGSGTTDQLFGARTTNVLQKATVYLATLFFAISLALAVMIGKQSANNRKSLVAEVVPPAAVATEVVVPAEEKPLEPEAVTPAVETPAPAETPVAPVETPAPVEDASATPAPVEPTETPAEPAAPAENTTPEQP
jgi:preprotein translocase subunit SecG